jgi:hypothetical protein
MWVYMYDAVTPMFKDLMQGILCINAVNTRHHSHKGIKSFESLVHSNTVQIAT